MDCSGVCNSETSCAELEKRFSPVAFQFSGYIFEMNPSQYLQQYDDACVILLHRNLLPPDIRAMYLAGSVFLKNFYSVYDFEQDTLSLGVNKHAEGKVHMYKPDQLFVSKGARKTVATSEQLL